MRSFDFNRCHTDSGLYQFSTLMFEKIRYTIRQQYLGIRGIALYMLPLPLWLDICISLLSGRLGVMTGEILAAVCFAFAGYFTREHFRERREHLLATGTEHAEHDRRPAAAGLTALGCFLLALVIFRRPPLLPLIMAALGALGYCLNYIADDAPYQKPSARLKRNIPETLPSALEEMLNNAYSALENMEVIAVRLKEITREYHVARQLEKVTRTARLVIYHIQDSPERIRAARSFLVVHLQELNHICQQYSDNINTPEHDRQQAEFQQLLLESEHAFIEQKQQLTQQQQQNLDTRMQVLREQLTRSNNDDL